MDLSKLKEAVKKVDRKGPIQVDNPIKAISESKGVVLSQQKNLSIDELIMKTTDDD